MGGYGSGRYGGRPTVESALQLDIDYLVRQEIIRFGSPTSCELRFSSDQGDLDVECEARVGDPWNSWIRLRYVITDYWTDEPRKIDEKIFLATSRPPFGGLRWWFVCPSENRRVRKLYLPFGANRFRCRHTYRLAYASQRETLHDRAMRRVRKLTKRLGGDPADDEYPDKPPRMRWTTYNRLMDKIVAADRVADARIIMLAARWMARCS